MPLRVALLSLPQKCSKGRRNAVKADCIGILPYLGSYPPDLMVKPQPVDIVSVILWLILRLRAVYQREIKS